MANSMKQFQLVGLSELSSNLNHIRKELQSTAQYEALGAGAFILKKKARTYISSHIGIVKYKGRVRKPGKLRRSVIYTIFKSYINFGVTEKGAYGFLHTKDPVAHLIEFGHRTRGGGGFVPPKPFMRRAIDESGGEALDAIAKKLEEFFNK